jgi:4-amino-4-deoxy-L-arabinose transferase-like glycosyltransferase
MTKDLLSKKTFLILLTIVSILNLTGLFNEILEPDGTLYAGLAKEIANSGNWLNLWINGADWLDKPHLPFWMAAMSFKIFGVNAFAYKLPSFLMFFVSVFYCYKLADAIYSKDIARFATLIYATALHTIISNFDGKVEIYLTAFVIASTYHLYKAFEKKWFWHVVAAAFFAALAMMTKGLFAVITVAAGFVIYWVKTKQWAEFIKLKWYVFVLLTLIFILPELYALYAQFDMHPEKVVFGKTNVSGLKFFFWDSQFGRFFNNGPIKGKGDLSFFLHTTLWAYLPWSIFLLLGVINLFSKKKINTTDISKRWIIGGSALISFLMFSVSKFQLPHYVVILFPHFAMITAAYLLERASAKTLKAMNVFQTVLFGLMAAMVVWLVILYGFANYIWFLVFLAVVAAIVFFYKTDSVYVALLKKNIGFALAVAVFLNCLLYPSMLQYQAGMMAGKWMNTQSHQQGVMLYKSLPTSFDFYYNGKIDYNGVPAERINAVTPGDSLFIFSYIADLKDVNTAAEKITVIKSFPHFHVSQVNGKFINYKTRNTVLDTMVIAVITSNNILK